jgi:hypothetical protein
MKKIESISFVGFILIPAKSKFSGELPYSHYLGDFCNSNEKEVSSVIYVIIFNCERVEEIISLVELEIKKTNEVLVEYPGKKIFLNQLEFFSDLKKNLECPAMKHDAPDELLEILSKTGEIQNLKREGVIYLSGVSSLVEI